MVFPILAWGGTSCSQEHFPVSWLPIFAASGLALTWRLLPWCHARHLRGGDADEARVAERGAGARGREHTSWKANPPATSTVDV